MVAVAMAVAGGCAHAKPAGDGLAVRSATAPVGADAKTYSANLTASLAAAGKAATPLCGFPLKACAPGTYGKVQAQQPPAQTVSGFVELDLTKYFQSDAVVAPQKASHPAPGTPGVQGSGRFSLQGAGQGLSVGDIPAPFAPNTGSWDVAIQDQGYTLTVPFLRPAGGAGVKDAFDLAGQVRIPVTAGKYLGVWILEAGVNGGGSVDLQADYTDGTTQNVPMYFQADCSPGATAANPGPREPGRGRSDASQNPPGGCRLSPAWGSAHVAAGRVSPRAAPPAEAAGKCVGTRARESLSGLRRQGRGSGRGGSETRDRPHHRR